MRSADVSFERVGEDAVWVASVHGVPTSRVSRSVVDLLEAMDGETPLHVLRTRFAPSESSESFLRLVERFRASGLLEGAGRIPPGRLSYRAPLTLQVATLRAPELFRRLHRLLPSLPKRVMLIPVVMAGLGAVAALLQAADVVRVVVTPVPLAALLGTVIVLGLLTLLHETAHGLTLTGFGGTPRRAGFMIFYLAPAFFVDVTDGWRLRDRGQRVSVALAGPAVHVVAAGVALVAALALPPSELRQAVLLAGVSCVLIVLINLIPFVRFDGYIALMSALDEPNLRERTIRDASDRLVRLLFGGGRSEKRVPRWWSVPFGLASLFTPCVLVFLAVARVAKAGTAGGPVLSVLTLALEVIVAITGLTIVLRALVRVLRAGVSRVRFATVLAVMTGAVVIAGALIPVPRTVTLGFWTHDGRMSLVQAGGGRASGIPDGTRVDLMTSGILGSAVIGTGTVVHRSPTPVTVPLDALVPVSAPDVAVAAVSIGVVELSPDHPAPRGTGQARAHLGTTDLWHALWTAGVTEPLSTLMDER
ncbi:daptide biosynthesis intramembrane metalloprotease [Microbacterium sp. NPDC059771]|uniref:daptide biosynthesis intramembrane metalloprotease n=1 Tax=Microbacterium sp. NPDC059771 TaxID=3346941 RepID=UPI00365F83BD